MTSGCGLALVLVALAAGPAHPQAEGRGGMWVGGNLGFGWNFADATGWMSPQIRLGRPVGDRLLLGVEGSGFVWPQSGTWSGAANVMAIAWAYPFAERPYYARVGMGSAHARLAAVIFDALEVGYEHGIGAVAGLGRVSPRGDGRYAITYGVDVLVQSYGSRTYDTTVTTLVVSVGLTRGGSPGGGSSGGAGG